MKALHLELRVPHLGGGPEHTSSQQVNCIFLACVNRGHATCRRANVDCDFYVDASCQKGSIVGRLLTERDAEQFQFTLVEIFGLESGSFM